MGMRFRRSKKISKGVKLNVNKRSASLTFGGKGAKFTTGTSGRSSVSVGIPGTGLSYQHTLSGGANPSKASAPHVSHVGGSSSSHATALPVMAEEARSKWYTNIFLIFFLFMGGLLLSIIFFAMHTYAGIGFLLLYGWWAVRRVIAENRKPIAKTVEESPEDAPVEAVEESSVDETD